MNKVRVRYAPSPTGYLHIGGARSALFNYLFAKKYDGDFVFRIEDTDIERNIEGAEYSQLHDLLWLGIIPDESIEEPNPKYAPYRQMEKLDLYRKYADELVKKGYAYECYCTSEELEHLKEEQEANGNSSFKYDRRCLKLTDEEKAALKAKGLKPSIRLKVPSNEDIIFNDLVRGPVKFNSDDFGDFVIIKSNGIPTYNFAVVIDDHIMEISHVLRGEEHLSNTPKQIMIYNYFGWEIPTFGHMTIIVNKDGKKLSKRDHNIMQFMSQYKEKGYLPEAIVNFILLLGWTPEDNNEIYTLEEASKAFDPKRLSRSPSMFDDSKLNWMNSYYIKQLDDKKYLEIAKNFVKDYKFLANKSSEEIDLIINIFKNEIVCFADLMNYLNEVFEKDNNYSLSEENIKTISVFENILKNDQNNVYTKDSFKILINQVIEKTGVKGKDLYMPIRLSLTGREHGVELFNVINILGKEEALNRLEGETNGNSR